MPLVCLWGRSFEYNPSRQSLLISSSSGVKFGYILFTTHVATAESQLAQAVSFLKQQNITELVLDLRYNGGGALYIAAELGYMIAGPARTNGKTFDRLIFNEKNPYLAYGYTASDLFTPFYGASSTNSALPAQLRDICIRAKRVSSRQFPSHWFRSLLAQAS